MAHTIQAASLNRLGPVCVLAALLALPSQAEERNGTESAEDFIRGNLEFALLHEIAHLLIAEFDIPILGPEEQAADYFAITILLRVDRFNVERADRARAFLLSTAEAFELAWQRGKQSGADIPYWSGHSLGIQRVYNIACLLYGAAPDLFDQLPARIGLPQQRRQGCPAEYALAVRAVEWVLAEYGRGPDDATATRFSVRYDPPSTRASSRTVASIRASGLVENTVTRVEERFALREPVQIVFRACRHPEARWDQGTRELTVCYELLDLFADFAKRRRR